MSFKLIHISSKNAYITIGTLMKMIKQKAPKTSLSSKQYVEVKGIGGRYVMQMPFLSYMENDSVFNHKCKSLVILEISSLTSKLHCSIKI